jgi:hypothetical protein
LRNVFVGNVGIWIYFYPDFTVYQRLLIWIYGSILFSGIWIKGNFSLRYGGLAADADLLRVSDIWGSCGIHEIPIISKTGICQIYPES